MTDITELAQRLAICAKEDTYPVLSPADCGALVEALYRHAQPAPVVPNFKKLARELVENLVDCGGLDAGVKGKYLKWTEKTCRAAMLTATPPAQKQENI